MMFKQPIAVLVLIPKTYLKINMDMDLFLVILIARGKYRLLIRSYSCVNLKFQR